MRTTTIFAQGFALIAFVASVPLPVASSQQLDTAIATSPAAVSPGTDLHEPPPLGQPADNSSTSADEAAGSIVRPIPLKKLPDFNRSIFYRNKTEFSLETGWLPNNIPFVFDFLVGSKFTTWPLHYTLAPNLASVRWQVDNPWGWKILRGTTEFSFSGSYTAIPRGPETRYFAFDYGIRRYFVQPRWRVIPYFEGRGGVGDVNAKEPLGIEYAQGQNLTFTLMMGSGARYNFTQRYGMSAGMTYMHMSNFYLSEPQWEDFGINVYGAMVGVYMRLGKAKQPVL
jgi:hypothetical protein